jgi:hypothetical protein
MIYILDHVVFSIDGSWVLAPRFYKVGIIGYCALDGWVRSYMASSLENKVVEMRIVHTTSVSMNKAHTHFKTNFDQTN